MKDLETKLDRLDQRLDHIDITLAKQHLSLEEHMKRCDLLEADIKPIKKLVYQIIGVVKFLGLVAVIGSVYTFLKKVL